MLFSKSRKKGAKEVSAAASAALIGVIGLSIIIYIILIPPELRQQLLDEGEIPGFPVGGEINRQIRYIYHNRPFIIPTVTPASMQQVENIETIVQRRFCLRFFKFFQHVRGMNEAGYFFVRSRGQNESI